MGFCWHWPLHFLLTEDGSPSTKGFLKSLTASWLSSLASQFWLLPELRQLHTLSSGLSDYSTRQQQRKRSWQDIELQIIPLPWLPGTLTIKWKRTAMDSGREISAVSLRRWPMNFTFCESLLSRSSLQGRAIGQKFLSTVVAPGEDCRHLPSSSGPWKHKLKNRFKINLPAILPKQVPPL